MKCQFIGCRHEAKFECRKLWKAAKGEILYTCGEHKPDPDKRPESLKKLPFFYAVKPVSEVSQ